MFLAPPSPQHPSPYHSPQLAPARDHYSSSGGPSSFMYSHGGQQQSSLGHGFPSPSSQHLPPRDLQQQPNRPGPQSRSVTGEKRKRNQSESWEEQEEAEVKVGRPKVERGASTSGDGGSGEEDDQAEYEGEEGGASLDTLTFETGLSEDEGGAGGSDDDEGPSKKPRGSTGAMIMDKNGRKKIQIKYIEDKSRRHITFSKRKAGIMKKAFELSTLTGTQVLLLVVSETGLVYTFTTSKLQPLVTKPEGKNLIQACLNAPTGEAPGGGPSGPGGMTTGNRSRSSTTPGLPIRHKDDTIEYGPDPTEPPLQMKANGQGMLTDAGRLSSSSTTKKAPAGGAAKKRTASTKRKNSADEGLSGSTAGPQAPPITGDMLKKREAEMARRDGGSSSSVDPSLQLDPHAAVVQQQQQQQQQPPQNFSYSHPVSAIPLPLQQPSSQHQPLLQHQSPQLGYTPHPPPHLQHMPPNQQYSHPQYAQQPPNQPGPPNSPARLSNAGMEPWMRQFPPSFSNHSPRHQQPQPQQQQAYPPPNPPPQHPNAQGLGSGYQPYLAPQNCTFHDSLPPSASGGGGGQQAQDPTLGGAGPASMGWPTSLYNT